MLLGVLILMLIQAFTFIAAHLWYDDYILCGWWESGWAIFFYVISVIVCAMWLAIIPCRWDGTDFIKAVQATQAVVDSQRGKDISEFERVALSQEIIGYNARIAERQNAYKFWRAKFWTHPDIMKLEPIK